MIKKLFGETEEKQFEYLKTRLSALGIGGVVVLLGALLALLKIPIAEPIGTLGIVICLVVLLMFGWNIVRGVLGFASIAALFSNNVVIGVVIFVLFLMIGYLGGFFVAFIGICRFLVLLKKRKK